MTYTGRLLPGFSFFGTPNRSRTSPQLELFSSSMVSYDNPVGNTRLAGPQSVVLMKSMLAPTTESNGTGLWCPVVNARLVGSQGGS